MRRHRNILRNDMRAVRNDDFNYLAEHEDDEPNLEGVANNPVFIAEPVIEPTVVSIS
jgi:pyridoxine 5'-phosphate synthase PdxJ